MNTEPFNTTKRKLIYISVFAGLLLGFSIMAKIFSGLFTGLGKFLNIYVLGQWFGEAISQTYTFTYLISFLMTVGLIAIFISARKGQYVDADKIDAWYDERKFFIIVNTVYHVITCAIPMLYFFAVPDRLLLDRGQYINSMISFFLSPQLFLYYLTQNPIIGYLVNILIFLTISNLLFMKRIKV